MTLALRGRHQVYAFFYYTLLLVSNSAPPPCFPVAGPGCCYGYGLKFVGYKGGTVCHVVIYFSYSTSILKKRSRGRHVNTERLYGKSNS